MIEVSTKLLRGLNNTVPTMQCSFEMSRSSMNWIEPPLGKYSEIRRHLKFNYLPSTNLYIAEVAPHRVWQFAWRRWRRGDWDQVVAFPIPRHAPTAITTLSGNCPRPELKVGRSYARTSVFHIVLRNLTQLCGVISTSRDNGVEFWKSASGMFITEP